MSNNTDTPKFKMGDKVRVKAYTLIQKGTNSSMYIPLNTVCTVDYVKFGKSKDACGVLQYEYKLLEDSKFSYFENELKKVTKRV